VAAPARLEASKPTAPAPAAAQALSQKDGEITPEALDDPDADIGTVNKKSASDDPDRND
jgi:hypothetical protein